MRTRNLPNALGSMVPENRDLRLPLIALLGLGLAAGLVRSQAQTVQYYGRSCGVQIAAGTWKSGTRLRLRIMSFDSKDSPSGFFVLSNQRAIITYPYLFCPLLASPLLILPSTVKTPGLGILSFSVPVLTGAKIRVQALRVFATKPQLGFGASQGAEIPLSGPTIVKDREFSELFIDSRFFDKDRSSADWGGGRLKPRITVGGSGILGDFSADLGKWIGKDKQGRDVFEWDTSSLKIPSERTLDGRTHTVSNGVFEFSSFTLKANERLRIVGRNIPRFLVSGKVEVHGVIEVAVPDFKMPAIGTQGLPGGKGGPGGGTGGQGGDSLRAQGAKLNGRAGTDLRLPTGHPRSPWAIGTGGKGSVANPADGKSFVFVKSVTFSRQIAAGGAGGSLWSPDGKSYLGLPGKALKTRTKPQWGTYQAAEFGPPSSPGKTFPVLPVVVYKRSTELFLIGGSGGGGGGAQGFYSISTGKLMSPGAGGGGGGGALNIQSGGDMVLGSTAEIYARGGSAYNIVGNFSAGKTPAPGGGGSGGSVLLQCGGGLTLKGKIDVTGGLGGSMTESVPFLDVKAQGGNGGAGYIRIEANPTPSYTQFNFLPKATPDNVGPLRFIDAGPTSLAVSRWVRIQSSLGVPIYHYYVIQAEIDGVQVVFSDNPSLSSRRAESGQAVVFQVQGGRLSSVNPPAGRFTPWIQDGRAGGVARLNPMVEKLGARDFRFALILDRSKVVKSLKVFSVRVFHF